MTTIISSLKFPDSSSDSESGRNPKGNAEDSQIAPLGEPYKDDRKFFWQRPSAKQSEAIATQVGRTSSTPAETLLNVLNRGVSMMTLY